RCLGRQRCRPNADRLVGRLIIKPLFERPYLISSLFCLVDAGYQRFGFRHIGEIPADVLAGRADSSVLAVKTVVVFEVLEQTVAQLAIRGRRKMVSGFEEMRDLAEYPGTPL